jgi:hypothetical protein
LTITRIQIEGGFLDGFDLRPSPGLNVLIGARGTGKTSIIELIRFALAAKSHTKESRERSLGHARAILDGGEVTVTVEEAGLPFEVSRTANEEHPRSNITYLPPIVLSQTEIETLGMSEAGRMALIDGFITKNRITSRQRDASIVASIKATISEIESVQSELSLMADSYKESTGEKELLKELEKRQLALAPEASEIGFKQKSLGLIGESIASLSVQESAVERFQEKTRSLIAGLEAAIRESYGDEPPSDDINEDALYSLRRDVEKNVGQVKLIKNNFEAVLLNAGLVKKTIIERRGLLENQTRTIRADLEKHLEGSGALARQIGLLKTSIAQNDSRAGLIKNRLHLLSVLRAKRNEELGALEELRLQRSKERAGVISAMNLALSPHIRLFLVESSQTGSYATALIAALRGSGLRYNDLANNIASKVSPRELLKIVEGDQFQELAEILEIPKDRASRLIGSLKESGMGDVLTCDIEDDVQMGLLDGAEYKDISALSAGQRCTVVLSIVLQHKNRILVVDQPEDHLDNAFIANTIIKSIRERKLTTQIILSTHNANIPVLGEADLVVELSSDGRHGFIEVCKPLQNSEAVAAITNVMEGGRAAFAQRAAFYESHEL